MYSGEPSAFHRPLVPLGNCARHLPMVFIGTGLQGVSQLRVHFLKELKFLRATSAPAGLRGYVLCPEALPFGAPILSTLSPASEFFQASTHGSTTLRANQIENR